MIPILYSETETTFASNGLGRLSDAVECTVTEERNGKYELEMEYPLDGIHFEDITVSKIIYAVPADGKNPQPFRIYYISKPINEHVTIKAEHISYQLSMIPVQPFTTTTIGGALIGLTNNAGETCPFTFWTDKTSTGDFEVEKPSSIRSILGGTKGSILDVYGGEYEFDGYTVKLHQQRGYDRGVILRYGKNITDIKQEENIANTRTGVMPFWKKDSDDEMVMLTEKVLHSSNASNFPYYRTVPLDLSSEFDDPPTETQLRSKAQSYMTSNKFGIPSISINVSFVALWQTEEYKDIANLERVNLCDTVTVYFSKLGISATAKVVETVYNVLADRYDNIKLGEARTNLSQAINTSINSGAQKAVEDLPSKSFLRKSVERATQLITGGLGGYIVMTPNADGEPQEILVMDTDDIQTAVNIIRINKNGIGFSSNGYAGPFASAWTIDGHFVADFIDTGNLNASLITTGSLLADLIKSGRIESKNGRVYFDLDHNELACNKMRSPEYTGSDSSLNYLVAEINNGSLAGRKGYKIYHSSYQSRGLVIQPGMSSSGRPTISSEAGLEIECYLNVQSDPVSTNPATGMGHGGLYINESNSVVSLEGVHNAGHSDYAYIDLYPAGYNRSTRNRVAVRASTFIAGQCEFGTLSVSGSKSRKASTDNYGERLLYCYEMPSPIFGDVGSGKTDDDGICVVEINDIFSETARTDFQYQVFLQKEAEGDLWVEEKTFNYFIVKGTPNIKFSWELKAKQKGFEYETLENPENENIVDIYQPDFSGMYLQELIDLINEQEEIIDETA